jgi:chemotaxis response regulator CheB
MKVQWPDVLVIDIEMPRMDGLTFLKKIMSEHPTPTIVCSSLAEKGAAATMDAWRRAPGHHHQAQGRGKAVPPGCR